MKALRIWLTTWLRRPASNNTQLMNTDGLIIELDKTLAMVSVFFKDARNDADRCKWRIRLDQLLDERLKLMKVSKADHTHSL